MKNKKIINWIVTIIVAVAVFFFMNQLDLFNKKSIDAQLSKLSEDINKRAPIQMDRNTVIETSVAEGKTLTIKTRIIGIDFNDVDKNELNDFKNIIYLQLRNGICTNDKMVSPLNKGAILKYMYVTEEGENLFTITLKNDDCLKMKLE